MLSIRLSCNGASTACSGLNDLTDLLHKPQVSVKERDFREDRNMLISNNKKRLPGGVEKHSMS